MGQDEALGKQWSHKSFFAPHLLYAQDPPELEEYDISSEGEEDFPSPLPQQCKVFSRQQGHKLFAVTQPLFAQDPPELDEHDEISGEEGEIIMSDEQRIFACDYRAELNGSEAETVAVRAEVAELCKHLDEVNIEQKNAEIENLNEKVGRWHAELTESSADAATAMEDLDERVGRWHAELAASEADAVAKKEVAELCPQFQHQVQEEFTAASGDHLSCLGKASMNMTCEDERVQRLRLLFSGLVFTCVGWLAVRM